MIKISEYWIKSIVQAIRVLKWPKNEMIWNYTEIFYELWNPLSEIFSERQIWSMKLSRNFHESFGVKLSSAERLPSLLISLTFIRVDYGLSTILEVIPIYYHK